MTKPSSTDQGRLTLRTGKPDDVAGLISRYGKDHFHEGGFDAFATVDLERATREMTRLVGQDDTPLIIAEVAGEPVGWISWTMMHTYTTRPIAVLWTIYVAPEHRNGSVGWLLIQSAMDIAKLEGACAFFATVAPTGPGGQALCRLFTNLGFSPMGGAFSKGLLG